jgi:cytochrome c oxidase subunit II
MWNFPLFPDQASTFAPKVDLLFAFLMLVLTFFSLLIALLITFFAIKYHHKSKADRRDAVDSHLLLELVWTGIPLVIVMGVFVWGAQVFYEMKTIPSNALEIFVIGKQWMWKIQHPEGQREINELHVPAGRPIQLTMISEDVIHDFAVPAFRMKQDVLPGRYTKEWFQATKTGEYHLFCNQYCGTSHAQMVGKIIVMTPVDYEHWLSGGAAPPPPAPVSNAAPTEAKASAGAPAKALDQTMVAAGANLFNKEFNCVSCHKFDGTGQGPSLQGLFGRKVALEGGATVMADEGYIRESILQPMAKIVKGYKPVMPTYQGQLEETDITQLLAYIESLKGSK